MNGRTLILSIVLLLLVYLLTKVLGSYKWVLTLLVQMSDLKVLVLKCEVTLFFPCRSVDVECSLQARRLHWFVLVRTQC